MADNEKTDALNGEKNLDPPTPGTETRNAKGDFLLFLRHYFLSPLASSVSFIKRLRDRPEPTDLEGTARSGPAADPSRSATSWISFSYKGFFTLAVSLLIGYLFAGAILHDLSTDIAVAPPSLPRALADSGLSPSNALDRAINNLPARLKAYQVRFAESRRHLAQFPELIEIGQERYCPEAGFDKLVTFDSAYFSTDNQKSVKSLSDLQEGRLQYPFVEQSLNFLRNLIGKRYLVIRTDLIAHDGGYKLVTSINPVSGSKTNATPQTFEQPVLAPTPHNLQALLEEIVMRAAYPELAGLVRGTRGRTDLAIETFIADEYPTADRSLMLNVALYATLHNRNNALRRHDNKRKIQLLREIIAKSTFNHITTDKRLVEAKLLGHELEDLVPTRAVESDDDIAILFRGAEKILHEDAAEALGFKLDDLITNSTSQRRFSLDEHRIVETWLAGQMRHSKDFSAVASYRQRLDESLRLADGAAAELQGNIRAALHDSIMIYAVSVYGKAAQNFHPTKGLPTEAREQLARFIEFHDAALSAADTKWSLFTAIERDYLETLAATAQLLMGETPSALARITRISRSKSPCVTALAGSQLFDIARATSAAGKVSDQTTQILEQSYALMKLSEHAGMRNFQLYNIMGTVASSLGKSKEAIEFYDSAAKYDGEIPWARLNAGYEYLRQKNYTAAEGKYRDSLDESYRECKEDRKIWAEIDERYNRMNTSALEAAAKKLGSTVEISYFLINTSPTSKDCSVPNAVYGLIDSLSGQEKAGEYFRIYREYLSDPTDHLIGPTAVRAALTNIRRWHCEGRLREMPYIPDELSSEFPVDGDAFVCP